MLCVQGLLLFCATLSEGKEFVVGEGNVALELALASTLLFASVLELARASLSMSAASSG